MTKTLIEMQNDPTGKPTGTIMIIDHWGLRKISLGVPILSYSATVNTSFDIDREKMLSILVDIKGDGNPQWINYTGQQVWLVLDDRYTKEGYPQAFFAD